MHYILFKGTCRHGHIVGHARHRVDQERGRAADIDHHRRMQRHSVCELHVTDSAAFLWDFSNCCVEAEAGPVRSGGALQIVCGKGWVGHLSGGRKENAVGDLTTLRRAEIGTPGALRRVVGLHIIDR